MDFFRNLMTYCTAPPQQPLHIPLQPVISSDTNASSSNGGKELLHWLNEGISNAYEPLNENNKENDPYSNALSNDELHAIHVELDKVLDFYAETRRWIPSTIHVECKIKSQWETLVFHELNGVIDLSLQDGGSPANLEKVKNFTELHQNLKEALRNELSVLVSI